jgi:hypothetical protein
MKNKKAESIFGFFIFLKLFTFPNIAILSWDYTESFLPFFSLIFNHIKLESNRLF